MVDLCLSFSCFYPFALQLLLRFDVPEDGFPSIEDWTHTFTSILLGGLDLQREPLDVSIPEFKPDGASAASMASLLI